MKRNIKKLTAVLLSIAVVLSACGVLFATAATVKYGDINADGAVTSADALMALQAGANKRTLTEEQKVAGDVDGNFTVNSVDALLILQYSVGKIKVFPIEPQPTPGKQDLGIQNIPIVASDSSGKTLLQGYATSTPTYEPDENAITCLYQMNDPYTTTLSVDTDCVMFYAYGTDEHPAVQPYVDTIKETNDGDTVLGLMLPANRDSGEYVVGSGTQEGKPAGINEPAHGYGDIQKNSSGAYYEHSKIKGETRTVYYMCPTEEYIDFKWRSVKYFIDQYDCKLVCLEEPEYWNLCGYSDGYKREWQKHFGSAWIDPASSDEASYLHQQFRVWLFQREFEYIGGKLKEYSPDCKFVVATHSLYNYMNHKISAGVATYAHLDCVDGIIGQTWTDSVSMKVPYSGQNAMHAFAAAFFEYSYFSGAIPEGKDLYLLQDPSGDNTDITAEEYEVIWRQTVVAALLQQDTDYWQNIIWPNRSYATASTEKKTLELNVNKLMTDAGLGSVVYSGTRGIYLGVSDSASWENRTGNSLTSLYNLGLSLAYDGIQLSGLDIDHLESVDDLKDVNLLVLGYDYMKPLSASSNKIIAQWVKNGGRLLYLGGNDNYVNMNSSWWKQAGTTPLKDLTTQLGINVSIASGNVPSGKSITWTGAPAGTIFANTSNGNTYSFSGDVNGFMNSNGCTIGIEKTVGKGKFICVGLTSDYYYTNFNTEKIFRSLCKKALEGSGHEYLSNMNMCAQRGNFYAYYNLSGKSYTAYNKTLIDLFSSNLDVITGGKLIASAEPHLYYDITGALAQGKPNLAFTNGVETAPTVETATTTEFTITCPSGSTTSSRLACCGKYVQDIKAVDSDGKDATVITMYDETYETMLVSLLVADNTKPVTVTVTWGNTYKKLDTNYKWGSVNVRCDKYRYDRGEDIFYDASQSNVNMNGDNGFGGVYFCDGGTQAVWKIRLADYLKASMTLTVRCKYVISYSFDGQNWTVIEDYSQLPGVSWSEGCPAQSGSNQKTITVNSTDYEESKTAEYMYVKLSACWMDAEHGGGGWGGHCTQYSVNYLKPVE